MVQKIGSQIASKDKQGAYKGNSQKKGDITAQPGSDGCLPQSRVGKYLLHQDRASENFTD